MTVKKTLKKKVGVKKATPKIDSNVADNIMGSANEIWLAGLGAFAKAQQEGVKIFNKLVDEGKGVEKIIKKNSQSATKEVKSTVDKVKGKASQSWDKLENIFESRVQKTLEKLDIPNGEEIGALLDKVEALALEVSKLTGSYVNDVKDAVTETSKKAPVVKKTVAKKTDTVKKVAKKVTKKTAPVKKVVKKVTKKVTEASK